MWLEGNLPGDSDRAKISCGALRSVLWSPGDLEARESQWAFPRRASPLNQRGAACPAGSPQSMDPMELLRLGAIPL